MSSDSEAIYQQAYSSLLIELSRMLGSDAHAVDIANAIRALKKRVETGDAVRNERAQVLGRQLRCHLQFLGITDAEIRRVDKQLDEIASKIAETCGDIHVD